MKVPGQERFTTAELANYLGISERTVINLATDRLIAHRRIGSKYFFDQADVVVYLKRNYRPAVNAAAK